LNNLKFIDMVYLRINENSAQAKAFLEYVKTIPFVKVVAKEEIPNATTVKAIQEARTKEVAKAKDINDLINQLNT
jgi:antitoxin component of RelBE/YafQ-DinJ toxin-antitoxin module